MFLNQFTKAIAISPNDTIPPTIAIRAIYVGGAGDVAVKMPGDSAAVTFKAPPVGTILWVSPKFVMATNTTATLLIGLG